MSPQLIHDRPEPNETIRLGRSSWGRRVGQGRRTLHHIYDHCPFKVATRWQWRGRIGNVASTGSAGVGEVKLAAIAVRRIGEENAGCRR